MNVLCVSKLQSEGLLAARAGTRQASHHCMSCVHGKEALAYDPPLPAYWERPSMADCRLPDVGATASAQAGSAFSVSQAHLHERPVFFRYMAQHPQDEVSQDAGGL